ncbi:MAG: hypothetical protein OEV40_15845 [Acidimicrobiia bacterium]|nr:hypothetical protein [Acidimicrobiia bacterium]
MVKAKYSVGEYERRFLLDHVPQGVTNPRTIIDRYIEHTRLRLRTVDQPGVATDRKLGHKRRVVEDDPTAIMHTSLYLDEREFGVLAALPARRLVKTRWTIDVAGRPCSVNVFEEALAGLIVLEADLGDPELLAEFGPPPWAGPEVTHDEAFTGAALAGKSLVDLRSALAAAHRRHRVNR